MLNRVVLVGRLTKDPDLRYTPNGVAVANFTIAVNRPFSNQQGNREADFINCVVWRRPAENLANFMKKGSMIGVDGRVQTRTFEGQDGKTVFVTEIVADSVQFLESKGSSQDRGQGASGFQQNSNQNQFQPNQNQNQNQNQPQEDPFRNNGEPIDISDDDLPF
ncbi:single-stranded DNA-binding protein [Virgibacillus halodenitrificans]|jgi:single-strand DNA-binding protein|uniref:Single-stranded DNA-binding protein n=1 Tax=Virgibacillus halodenitrificans TaxID=1482 RepID=A0AAC9J3U5_VIRHA|nr:single-stranded DNA-binding protein [Virgibacillus halodenitrificans]APC50118.1 single-stranded DNA-binding protein [Virgibacillus halodenitrificans]MBD1222323.1 single-stranded DNA-binding protein [Virgibacillus halodenitrificans]MCG1027571.1 single-stranded DNA-binding protein [Virgibacillus halodenitrificans]MCJ0931560.1 single-stranded DNA-binding protein [Virgibacillus halodenitrificans]MEC2157617.1 single-stranded DNA-binding protein [Virgibacillus halodenitrificans]